MPTDLADIASRIRAAFDRTQASRDEWINATLDLAEALAEGRAHFPADREFGHWLTDQQLNLIGPNDRAALISIGRNLPSARKILLLTETQSRSWRTIAEQSALPKQRPHAPAAARRTPQVSQPVKPDGAEPAETSAEAEAANSEAEDVFRRPEPPPPPPPPPTPRQKTANTVRAALRTAVDPSANKHEAETALRTVQKLDPRLETIDKVKGEDFPLVATLRDQVNGYYDELVQLRETVRKLKEANERLTSRNREQRETMRQAVPVPPLEHLPELDITIERLGMEPMQFVLPAGSDAAGALKLVVEKLAFYVTATQEEVEADAAAENNPGIPHTSRSTTDAAL